MSRVTIRTVIDEDNIECWHITFPTGVSKLFTKESEPDTFSVVDRCCQEQNIPLPTEWRYE